MWCCSSSLALVLVPTIAQQQNKKKLVHTPQNRYRSADRRFHRFQDGVCEKIPSSRLLSPLHELPSVQDFIEAHLRFKRPALHLVQIFRVLVNQIPHASDISCGFPFSQFLRSRDLSWYSEALHGGSLYHGDMRYIDGQQAEILLVVTGIDVAVGSGPYSCPAPKQARQQPVQKLHL